MVNTKYVFRCLINFVETDQLFLQSRWQFLSDDFTTKDVVQRVVGLDQPLLRRPVNKLKIIFFFLIIRKVWENWKQHFQATISNFSSWKLK